MKDLRSWIFVGLLVFLVVQAIGCAPAPTPRPPTPAPTPVPAQQPNLQGERTRGNWTYIPINSRGFDPEGDLDVVSRWSDNNLRREVISFQFAFDHDSSGFIRSTRGVYIYFRPMRP